MITPSKNVERVLYVDVIAYIRHPRMYLVLNASLLFRSNVTNQNDGIINQPLVNQT